MWKPFDGIVVIEMAKKSLIFAFEFFEKKNALEPPSL